MNKLKKTEHIVEFTPTLELSVPKLTQEERNWVIRFGKCLKACPERFNLLSTGDRLMIVNVEGARRSELSNGAARKDGVQIAYVVFGPICHCVSKRI